MPRTILDKPKKYDRLVALIRGTADVQGKNFTDIGNILGYSERTIRMRLKNPENFTLDELYKLRRGLNVTEEEMSQCVKF